MGLKINTNTDALSSYRNLSSTEARLSKSLTRLSSGLRINSAADDAAGLSIATNLGSQVSGFRIATRNAQDGISLLQTADGALYETTQLLQRIRGLAVQAANTGANDEASREALGNEVTEALKEIDRIASATVFGAKSLLDGSETLGFTFHVGYAGDAFNQLHLMIPSMKATDLSITDTDIVAAITGPNAATALASIDIALRIVTESRSQLGAFQNRLQSTIANLSVAVENLEASRSRILDTDMAEEMTEFSKLQILQQAGTAMLAQANQIPQSVLSLLRQ